MFRSEVIAPRKDKNILSPKITLPPSPITPLMKKTSFIFLEVTSYVFLYWVVPIQIYLSISNLPYVLYIPKSNPFPFSIHIVHDLAYSFLLNFPPPHKI